MRNNPEKSQSEVFRSLSQKLSSIQRQLHSDYHKDRFLCDMLVQAADSPQMKRSFLERAPTTSHEAIQRIAALLSSEPGSAALFESVGSEESLTAHVSKFHSDRRYTGQAQKSFGRKVRFSNRSNTRKVSGCWVCGGKHFARDHHLQYQITQAL